MRFGRHLGFRDEEVEMELVLATGDWDMVSVLAAKADRICGFLSPYPPLSCIFVYGARTGNGGFGTLWARQLLQLITILSLLLYALSFFPFQHYKLSYGQVAHGQSATSRTMIIAIQRPQLSCFLRILGRTLGRILGMFGTAHGSLTMLALMFTLCRCCVGDACR